MIGGPTRLFVLLGKPVSHSLSPAMQNAAFKALGLDATYAALACEEEDVAALVRALVRSGGGGNATVPHKGALAAAVDRASDRVRRLGSANTFWSEDGAIAGESTDVDGVLDALTEIGAPATAWLVIGTGGSARAVVGAAAERGAKIAVRSRDPGRAASFESWAAALGVAAASPDACEVLINASPLGLTEGDPHPMVVTETPRATHALDLVYRRGGTAWVRHCSERGVKAADGRGMLVAQGAVALERWFPKVKAPREVMRAAVDRALA
jgi:shikimate dehydrogenase